ncbi:MAG: tripartite tricarboxylate transporter substrate binding protein [Arenicella sp.]
MKKILLLSVVFSTFMISNANATDWPSRTINLTVGYGAGGTTDSTARVLSSLMEKDLGKKVTVLNKPGGGGSVAAALAKTQKADGYNVFTFTTGAAVLTPHMQDLPYDPLKDFTFIAQFAQWNLGVVVPKDAPYNTLQELVQHAKANPGKISYAIAGTGTPQHLVMERLALHEGISWKAVPFKGGAASVTALLGGHVDVMAGATEWLPQVKSGDFKLLAILTEKPMKQFPEVPTLLGLGYPISAPSILGIAGPAGMPKDVVTKLAASIEAATTKQPLIDIIEKLAMQINYRGPSEFEDHTSKTFAEQGEIIKSAGLSKK